MSVLASIQQLLEHGHVVVTSAVAASRLELDAATQSVLKFELDYRKTIPSTASAVDSAAVRWSVHTIFQLMQLQVYPAGQHYKRRPVAEFPGQQDVSSIYSADLLLRFLPDLYRIATVADRDSPLVTELESLAWQWPFSSVGIPIGDDADIAVILADDCLPSLYLDRIVAKQDHRRLQQNGVRQAFDKFATDESPQNAEIAKFLQKSEATHL